MYDGHLSRHGNVDRISTMCPSERCNARERDVTGRTLDVAAWTGRHAPPIALTGLGKKNIHFVVASLDLDLGRSQYRLDSGLGFWPELLSTESKSGIGRAGGRPWPRLW